MTSLTDLRIRYQKELKSSFSKQDRFTTDKVVARSKRVLPRGRVCHRLVTLEVFR